MNEERFTEWLRLTDEFHERRRAGEVFRLRTRVGNRLVCTDEMMPGLHEDDWRFGAGGYETMWFTIATDFDGIALDCGVTWRCPTLELAKLGHGISVRKVRSLGPFRHPIPLATKVKRRAKWKVRKRKWL